MSESFIIIGILCLDAISESFDQHFGESVPKILGDLIWLDKVVDNSDVVKNFKVTLNQVYKKQRITFIPHHGFSHSGLYPVCQPETGFTQLNGCRCQIQCKNTVGCSNFGFYPATGLDSFSANMPFVPSCVHVLFFCAFFRLGLVQQRQDS